MLEAVKLIDAAYRERDERLARQDFKGAAESHFEFHRLVYANWPIIRDALTSGDAR